MMNDLAVKLSQRVERIKPSPTFAISARADELTAAGKPVINLSVGEPDFDTPQHIKDAAIKAIQAGATKYTAIDGIKELKQAIVDKFKRENQLTYMPSQILVSVGAKHSIYNLFAAVLNEGDEVIFAAPYWVSYPDMTLLTDGVPVPVKTTFAQHFKLQPEALEAAITPRTRIVLLNSPSNPTGIAYSLDELKALGEVIKRHPHVLVASDDIYEHSLFSKPFCNILNACPELYDRAVIINGVSKSYAMTGWRIGYAAGPAKVIAAMKKVQSQSTSNPTACSQYATIAALEGDQQCIKTMRKAYQERHDFVISELKTMPGISVVPSDGTFYTFPCVEGLYNKEAGINSDLDVAEFLLTEANLAVVPGSAFGTPGHIRLCFTTSMENLVEAVKRLRKAATLLKGKVTL